MTKTCEYGEISGDDSVVSPLNLTTALLRRNGLQPDDVYVARHNGSEIEGVNNARCIFAQAGMNEPGRNCDQFLLGTFPAPADTANDVSTPPAISVADVHIQNHTNPVPQIHHKAEILSGIGGNVRYAFYALCQACRGCARDEVLHRTT